MELVKLYQGILTFELSYAIIVDSYSMDFLSD